MSPVNVRIGNGPSHRSEADSVEAAAHQQEHAVAERGAEAQQRRPAQLAQPAAVAGARGEREEVDAQAVHARLLALLDQPFVDQLLQQPVRGGLREPELLAELADPQPALGVAGERLDDADRAMQARDRSFVQWVHRR